MKGVGQVGWTDLGKANRCTYLHGIRLDQCRNEEGSIAPWLNRRASGSVILNVTLGKVFVRQRK